MFKQFITAQLKEPSGLIGNYVLPFLWNRRNAVMNDVTLTRLKLDAHDRVLEVGFGGGYLIGKVLERLPSGSMSGVDASSVMVARGSMKFASMIKTDTLDLYCASVSVLPFPDAHFSKICSVNSLFYWPDFTLGIREIRRILSPGGLLVLTYTCKADMDKKDLLSEAVRTFTDEEVVSALQHEDVRVLQVEQAADRHRRFSIVTATR